MKAASHRAELLAPAGDRASLQAALIAGADAVYLGGARFNARAGAANFEEEGLRWARRVTRRLGRRLYVTFNTILFDHEWAHVEADLDFLEALQPDAIIVQDLGLLETLHRRGSRIPRHLSTQGAWDGAGGASVLQDLGVERVILPRETPWEDIVRLIEESPFEIETFVHGAHCYSVSGRCQWSVNLGPRSGNRGNCAQPCRRVYESEGRDASPFFSPKDLRLIARARELSAAGVAALKIEGRLKSARTIRGIVAAYRAVLDGKAEPAEVADALDLAFSREWCEGFLDGVPAEWRTRGSAGHVGLRVGEVLRPADVAGRVLIQADRPVSQGMGLSWNEPDGERDGRRGGVLVWASGDSGRIEARFRGVSPSRPGIVLYATASAAPEAPTRGWDPAWEAVGLTLQFEGRADSVLRCHYDAEGIQGTVESEAKLQPSRSGGLEDILAERFQSIGEELVVEHLDCSALEPGLFVPPSALKALRRAIVEGLKSAPIPVSPSPAPAHPPVTDASPADYAIRVYQPEHVEDFLREPAPPLGWVLPIACAQSVASRGQSAPLGYWIPWVFGPGAADKVAPLLDALPDGDFLCMSWEAIELARRFPRHHFSVDWTFNVSNARAAAVLQKAGVGFDAGLETPGALAGAQRVLRVNPLVSSSRFPGPAQGARAFRNDRGDVFHLQRFGAAEALFLERWPDKLPPGAGPIRVDAFVPPGESVAGLCQRLRSWMAGTDATSPRAEATS